jgi:hypothetical protein
VSTTAKPLLADGNKYREEAPLTGDESVVAEVSGVAWPKLLDPVDDLPPATIVTSVRRVGSKVEVRGVSHDNGEIVSVTVNDRPANVTSNRTGVVDWTIELPVPTDKKLTAFAADNAGNVERTAHVMAVE